MSIFQFKQFSVAHERSTLKIGVDAVLLGAWISVDNTQTILEIGTGCGVISFMLAQRSQAHLTAIDIDSDSIEEAEYNNSHSPWKNRISFHCIDIESFTKENQGKTFDCIVCNPPYFDHSLLSPNPRLNLGKHNVSLTFECLSACVRSLLHPQGNFFCIIPASSLPKMENACHKQGMYLSRACYVKSFPEKEPHRVLLCFEQIKKTPITEYLTIRDNPKTYSTDYCNLTKEFYINM